MFQDFAWKNVGEGQLYNTIHLVSFSVRLCLPAAAHFPRPQLLNCWTPWTLGRALVGVGLQPKVHVCTLARTASHPLRPGPSWSTQQQTRLTTLMCPIAAPSAKCRRSPPSHAYGAVGAVDEVVQPLWHVWCVCITPRMLHSTKTPKVSSMSACATSNACTLQVL